MILDIRARLFSCVRERSLNATKQPMQVVSKQACCLAGVAVSFAAGVLVGALGVHRATSNQGVVVSVHAKRVVDGACVITLRQASDKEPEAHGITLPRQPLDLLLDEGRSASVKVQTRR